MSIDGISQCERRPPAAPNDSKRPAEQVSQQLQLLGDLTRLQLAATLTKAAEELARRDPDEIFNRSHEVLELTQAADIVHGWSREKPDVWY
jgi:hypothetical protein